MFHLSLDCAEIMADSKVAGPAPAAAEPALPTAAAASAPTTAREKLAYYCGKMQKMDQKAVATGVVLFSAAIAALWFEEVGKVQTAQDLANLIKNMPKLLSSLHGLYATDVQDGWKPNDLCELIMKAVAENKAEHPEHPFNDVFTVITRAMNVPYVRFL